MPFGNSDPPRTTKAAPSGAAFTIRRTIRAHVADSICRRTKPFCFPRAEQGRRFLRTRPDCTAAVRWTGRIARLLSADGADCTAAVRWTGRNVRLSAAGPGCGTDTPRPGNHPRKERSVPKRDKTIGNAPTLPDGKPRPDNRSSSTSAFGVQRASYRNADL